MVAIATGGGVAGEVRESPSPEPRLIHREAHATDAARLALPNFLMLVSRWPRARNMILTLHAIADEAIE